MISTNFFRTEFKQARH